MTTDFSSIINDFVETEKQELEKLKPIANKIGCFKSVTISSSSTLELSKFKIKNVLYFLTLDPSESLTASTISKNISKEKADESSSLKLPQVNPIEFSSTERVIYVGKSKNLFSNRLKAHLGEASEKTYALHLNRWKKIVGKEVELILHYASIDKITDKQLELLETALHYKLKPILGRSGH
ncbi:hypothetical protein [Carboxylicivirga sp. N1Y90]|uniref:hypothetical protein n=1 Tax=Carboxylicivirga fragile TaxID=3417571 RepID=UPI003D34E764|nr:hypothetical protein [Marinilabiliaceae bacterium N1Y90]